MSDLVVGEVRGYRAWQLGADGHLYAISGRHQWDSATKKADCPLSGIDGVDHPAPFMGCTCGLYAYYRATTVPPSMGYEVFGVVAVAGQVILATRGMRAERMTVLALVTDDVAPGERYGVPIYPSREALLADYPPQDYSALVDVNPTDEPWPATGSPAVTVGVNPSGFVAGMREAAARAAFAVAARIVAAPNGVTAADAARILQHLSGAKQADLIALGLETRAARITGPSWRRIRREGTRR